MRYAVIVCAAAVSLMPAAVAGQTPSAIIESGTFRIGAGEALQVDLGSFTVPANRHRDASPMLTLRFVRFPSTAQRPGPPIVFLAGGPGDAATRAFRGMPRAFLESLRSIADVIAFDQRGTGSSEPRALCPPGSPAPLDRPLDPAALAASVRARLAACLPGLAADGIDVEGLTTQENADDVNDLRLALGVPRVQLLAGSYGTHLALAVARRHPSRVARMALLGVEGPDDTIKLPARVDDVLREIDAAHPGFVASLRVLRDRLGHEPWTKTLPNGQRVSVGRWDLERRVAEALDTTREIEQLVAALPVMMTGDYSDLVRWAIPFRAGRPINVMNLAMDCASFASADRLARIAAQAPASLLGTAMSVPLPDVCDVPGLPRLPDEFRAPLASNVPALLVAGTWDGRTPPANAEAVASGMPNARVLIVAEASHGLFQDAAVMAAVLRFLGG